MAKTAWDRAVLALKRAGQHFRPMTEWYIPGGSYDFARAKMHMLALGIEKRALAMSCQKYFDIAVPTGPTPSAYHKYTFPFHMYMHMLGSML